MTAIILAGHGKTAWNETEPFRSRTDIELSGTGMGEVELLAEYLSGIKIGAAPLHSIKRGLQCIK